MRSVRVPWKAIGWALAGLVALVVLWRFGDANPSQQTPEERRVIEWVNAYTPAPR